MGVRDWDIVTSYVDSVTTSLKTVTFPKVQELVKVTNKGNAILTYTIGSQSGTLTPGQSVTVKENISSFTLQAVSGTHTFELRASEAGTEKEDVDTNDFTLLKGKKTKTVFLGDSITIGSESTFRSYPLWFNIFTNHSHTVINKGVAGNTTAQMLARFDVDVLANKPTHMVFNSGKNDLGTLPSIPDQLKKDYATIVRKATIAGITPIVSTVIPLGNRSDGTTFYTQAGKDITLLWNAWIKEFARLNGIPCIDFYAALVGANDWAQDAYMQNDNLHPSVKGTQIMASLVIDLFDKFSLGETGLDYLTNNLVVNSAFVDSNSDGTPDNFTFDKGTATATSILSPHPLGGNMAKITMSAASPASVFYKQTINGVKPGDIVELSLDLLIEDVTAVNASDGVYLSLVDYGYTSPSVMILFYWKDVINKLYRYKSLPFTVPAGQTQLRLEIGFIRATSGTLYLGRPQIKKLN